MLSETASEKLIMRLADSLEVPKERYESAERSYQSLGRWFDRPESVFSGVRTHVYTQGSFRLGTPIRPISEDEHYDVDVVCELDFSKLSITQERLHSQIGTELIEYAKAHSMQAPTPSRRCWTLNYADSAQFHMDVLVCLPDAARQRILRERAQFTLDYVDKSVAITDQQHYNYRQIAEDWPVSNPNGYADWFYSRMRVIFEQMRKAVAVRDHVASVADIPTFRVKTPLQSAIQILKRHRDMRFKEDPDSRPSSIILTTLAAHAYQQEPSVLGALNSILIGIERGIEIRGGEYWIANPTDPRENFADHWRDDPSKREVFYEWLQVVRSDFDSAARQQDMQKVVDVLAPRLGRRLVEDAASHIGLSTAAIAKAAPSKLQSILDAPHKRPPIWPTQRTGRVWCISSTVEQYGWRSRALVNDGDALPPGCGLRFEMDTDIPKPYRVYWQIVNTGQVAAAARDLRGGFEETYVERGTLSRTENTKYAGSHSIECFIVKDGKCVAWSGPFVVNISYNF